jgi:two-component system sensor histidine kinase/response regulator
VADVQVAVGLGREARADPKGQVEGKRATEAFPGIEHFHYDFIGNLGQIGLHGGELDCEVLMAPGRWFRIHAHRSGPQECSVIFVDVSGQKNAEQAQRRQQAQLQAILDNSPVLISMKDTKGVVTLANNALLGLVGATHADQFVGRSVLDLFPPEVGAQLWANDLAALTSDAPVRSEERVQDKLGIWHTFLTIKFPVRDTATGEPYGVCAISTDITEAKRTESERLRLEQALLQSNKELEERVTVRTSELEDARCVADSANKAKSDFLATISHEMRTPLNGVIGLTALMLNGAIDESKRRHVELVQESGQTLLHLLNDFLDFSKIESGHLALSALPFDPEAETRKALSIVQVLADRKQLKIETALDLPACVVGDSVRLRQILLNLLSNAIKFTLQGGVRLQAHEVSRTGNRVVLAFEVIDTGIGIDAAVQHQLFQPFVQADASMARRFGGTGLGLAICERLAEAMGGEIGLASTLGEGSRFWVRLPFELDASPLS